MKIGNLFFALALASFTGTAAADPCDHNGQGSPPFCNGGGGEEPPGPPGHGGHGHGGHSNATATSTSNATAQAVSSSSSTSSVGNVSASIGDVEGGDAYASGGDASSYVGDVTAKGGDGGQGGSAVVDASSNVEIEGSTVNVEGSSVNAGSDVHVEGDRVEALEADDLPGIPAAVFTDACGSGVAAGFPGGSASIGQGNPVCLYLALARAAHELGDREASARALFEAERTLERQMSVRRALYLDAIPLFGRLF